MSEIDNNLQELFISKFSEFENNLNGQKSLPIHDSRKASLENFKKIGFPDKQEEYKYTNLKKAISKHFNFDNLFAVNDKVDSTSDTFKIKGLDGNILVFVNGVFSEKHSSYSTQDVTIKRLKEADIENKEEITRHFGQQTKETEDSFAAINSIYCNDGVYVHIEKNKISETPIIIYNVSNTDKGESISFPRNLILAESNSQSSIVEIYATIGDGNSFTNAVTEIEIGKNAICNYYKLSNDVANAYHIGMTNVTQDTSSTFNAHSYSFGGGMIRNNLRVSQNGEHCTTNMYGLYLLSGNSHVDNHTVVDHKKPNSYSNELYKGIFDDKSTGVFNGKIFVRAEAQKTNAFQSNKNILLTDTATINTKPQLEIWADDVKCSHGCTTGQMDEDALFYLRARGINKEQARAMLLYAFTIDVIDKIKIDALKKHINSIIAERFNQEEL